MNRAICPNSASESLNPGTISVTISTQKPSCFELPDGVEHVRQHAAELAVALVVEALQIDLVTGPRTAGGTRAPRACRCRSRRSRSEPVRLRLLEDLDRPLAGDERLVVGARRRRARRCSTASSASCSGGVEARAATAWSSRRACLVTQFWQYEQWKSQPSMPNERASRPGNAW